MSYREIEPEDARRRLDAGEAICVDIRDPESYSAGRIPGATRLDATSVAAFVADADRARPVIVCCYHGNSSRSAAAWLAGQGFAEVYSLTGGYEAWSRSHPSHAD